MSKIVDLHKQEVAEQPEQMNDKPRCEIVVGIRQDGEIYFAVGGDNPDLLTVEGLLSYAKGEMKRVWDARAQQIYEARQAANAEEAKTSVNVQE